MPGATALRDRDGGAAQQDAGVPLGEVMMNSRLKFPLETWQVHLSHFNSQDMMNMMGSTVVDVAIRICTRYGCPKKP